MVYRKALASAITIIFTAILLAACSEPSDPVGITRIVDETTTPSTTATPDESDEQPTPLPTSTTPPTDYDWGIEPVDNTITFNGYLTVDIPTLDPQLTEDKVSANYVENLFVQLTNYDLITSEIVPEAAESWDISEDGRLYTFHLRTDIPWVYHNPVTLETIQEIDEAGNPRFVTAQDFAYGIRRACDPNINSYYSGVIAPLIRGCEDVLNTENPDTISQELFDAIGVAAVDDATLTIELNFPAGYFLSMTPMWTLSAVPSWAIEEHGEAWIEAGNIVTNGRFVLNEWVHDIRATLFRNPSMPMDLRGTGNIEKHIAWIIPDDEMGYALWQNNEVDMATIPDDELESHLIEFADQTLQLSDLSVFFFSFQTTTPPFDNVHVRRAFSAAFDREKFVSDLLQGNGLPMKHLAPPGIFGAPPIDETGVGFDPEFARAELAAAGYPNCEGFPQITLTAYTGRAAFELAEFALEQWQEHLGCTDDQIFFEQPLIDTLLPITIDEISYHEGHHMFTRGWGPDYADQNNWVGDVLICNIGRADTKRSCNETDGLIVEAAQEVDPARRIELYAQIEEAFFGPEGEHPIMPIWVRTAFKAVHSWYDYTPALFGGDQWYNDNIDMEAKQAAHGY